MACVVTDVDDTGTATITPGRYCHRDITALSSRLGAGNYADLATEFKARIDAVLPTSGPSTVTIDLATGAYTLAFAKDTAVDFTEATLGNESGLRLAEALGFTGAHPDATGSGYDITLTLQDTYTSDVTPYYYLSLARDGLTHTEGWPPYQIAGQTKTIATTKGNGYGISPTTKLQLAEVKYGFQTQASIFDLNATAAAPWTYQALVTHAGAWEPIVLATTALNYVYKDRVGDFGRDERTSVWNAFHSLWNIDSRQLFIGYL